MVEQASRIEKMAATVKGLAAAWVAETGSWRTDGDRSPAHRLARRTGTSVVQAAATLDTARRLESLPETAVAARRGDLSAEQTCAMVDAAAGNTAAEHDLLEAARRSPLAELREQCARTKATAHVDLLRRDVEIVVLGTSTHHQPAMFVPNSRCSRLDHDNGRPRIRPR